MKSFSYSIKQLLLEHYVSSDGKYLFFKENENDTDPILSLRIDKYKEHFFGFVYEKIVGQYYVKLGYKVEYRGILNGTVDLGIDLEMEDPNGILCLVQCKHTLKNSVIGKSGIEKMLYSMEMGISKLVRENEHTKIMIIVPTKNIFSKRKMFTSKLIPRYFYPIDEHLERINGVSPKIKFEIVVVPSPMRKDFYQD